MRKMPMLLRCIAALGLSMALVMLQIDTLLAKTPLFLPLSLSMVITGLWGLLPGLLSATCGSVAANYFLLQPLCQLDIREPAAQACFAFWVAAIVINTMVHRLLVSRNQLRQAVQSRDAFLAIAGHELRTPLTALQLQVQSVQRQLERLQSSISIPQPPTAVVALKGAVDKQERLVTRLVSLVTQLLDVSHLTTGRLDMQPTCVNLTELLQESAELMSTAASRAGCALSWQCEADVQVFFDRSRLEQIIVNVLSNAIKYGAEKPIDVLLCRCGNEAQISITDHGIGIVPEAKERIFERFERAVSDRKFGGLGLGLWLSRHFLQMGGGRITVDSTPAQGATFCIYVPLANAARPAETA